MAAAAALAGRHAGAAGVYRTACCEPAFDAIQRRMGGSFAEWEGWDWISDFGDPIAEHHAVREAVGIWDESPLRKWFFKGKDALAAADYCFTSDMAALEVGQCRYGAFCDEHGKMLGDGVVFRGKDAKHMLVVTALDTDGDHFRRVCKTVHVEIEDATMDLPHLQVQGPRSRELLAACTDADVEGLRYFRFIPEPVTICGVEGCWLARTGYSGRARLRGVRPGGGRRAGVAGPARPGRGDRHPALRPGRGREPAHRGRADLPRLRLLPGRHLALPREPRSDDQARQGRLPRQGRAARRSWPRASRTAW